MLAVALFGYAIAHGFTFFYALFPLILAIFALPLWLEKRIGARSPRLAALVYAVPMVAIAGPIAYLFLFNPWYEEHVATAVLNEVRVAILGETPIKNRNGHVIGVKITYTVELPETVEYGTVAKGLLHSDFPRPRLIDPRRPLDSVEPNGGFVIYYRGAERISRTVGIEPGKITADAWKVPFGLRMQVDGFCKSKPYAGTPESVTKAIAKSFDYPRQHFAVELAVWVSKSYRMGGFRYDFKPAYNTKTEFDGPGLRSAVDELPPCDAETEKEGGYPPKAMLDHLQDFVAP